MIDTCKLEFKTILLAYPDCYKFSSSHPLRRGNHWLTWGWHRVSGQGGSLRHELYNIILNSVEDLPGFNRIAESLGLDPTVPRVALASELRLPDALPTRNKEELDRITLSISRTSRVPLGDLVQCMHRDRFVIWVPCIRGDSLLASDKRMSDLAERLAAAAPEMTRIGVGMMGQGPVGWASSMEEALRALEVGSRIVVQARTHRYSDIVLHEGARRSDNVLR